jgi:hypothetical protein
VAIDPEGEATEVALSLGKSVELTWLRGGERHSAALEPAACSDGAVTSSRGDTRLQIEAGPGWGTIGGRVSGALSGPIAAMKPR